jgi:uncharacterized protein (UPF0333 family)
LYPRHNNNNNTINNINNDDNCIVSTTTTAGLGTTVAADGIATISAILQSPDPADTVQRM